MSQSRDPAPAIRAHDVLRRETRVWHDRVEAAFAPFDLTTPEGLRGFLLAQSRAVIPLEQALETSGIGDVLADWPSRRRCGALLCDLSTLGTEPAPPCAVPDLLGTAHKLGALYVLEGSRLGGKLLAQRMERAGRQPPLPTGFLLQSPGPGAWVAFLAHLDAPFWPRPDLLAGAAAAFSMFHNAASIQAALLR